MNIVSARRFGLWTRLFRAWMKRERDEQTATILAAIPEAGSMATEANATANKEEILEAIRHIPGEEDEPISMEEMDELIS